MSKETILLKELKALTEQILQHFTNESLNLMRQFVSLEQKINECLKSNTEPTQEMPLTKNVIASPPSRSIKPNNPPVLDTNVFDNNQEDAPF